ncbi:MAG: tyrosine-protein kinase family protein [Hyphomicrobiaceae bacterium]
MAGLIVTFYSFKGGVGRSFAVANTATILAQWGFRVLVVDWDIEAPGLHHYFAPLNPVMPAGVIDFLKDCQQGEPRPWLNYVSQVKLPGGAQQLYLMPASGHGQDGFQDVVQSLNWDALYDEHDLGRKLNVLRDNWRENFDVILLDSRTGLTDFSGLTTVQLPDVLAFLFTANHQSLSGCCDIARRAIAARQNLSVDLPALQALPLVARFERREEYDRAMEWRQRFGTTLKPFFRTWTPEGMDHMKMIDLLTIPYVPRWTFGEDLAALTELADASGARNPSASVTYSLETIAALLAHRLSRADLLYSSRDDYVHAARDLAKTLQKPHQSRRRVLISSPSDQYAIVFLLHDYLQANGFEPVSAPNRFGREKAGASWHKATDDHVETADALLVLFTGRGSVFQEAEVERFLRHSLRSDVRKPVVPLILPGGETALPRSRLADFQSVSFKPGAAIEPQLEPVLARLRRH